MESLLTRNFPLMFTLFMATIKYLWYRNGPIKHNFSSYISFLISTSLRVDVSSAAAAILPYEIKQCALDIILLAVR